ncbi:hypothetical protein [Aestuariivita sp.]|jgi:hypothetical protein|uniref:hypothetical protein n=1 Tax=Aestuariivita sp. TaxID=1872407 RepID=UPI0021704872|nr:hypothetical protein [Aestuariivita sp.]MCE8006625.1 hypothetical protein [Aestuariivita sp.]
MCHPKDADASTPPTLSIDWEAYLPYLEDEDIPDTQKRVLIESLWSIMLSFVDLGFGLSPHQGLGDNPAPKLARSISNVVSSTQPKKTKKNDAALSFSKAAREESE